MQGSRRRLVLGTLLGVVLVNYVAQVVYYFHLYYPARLPLGTITLAATLVWFLAGYVLLAQGRTLGYWLLLSYLIVMVGFYLENMVNQVFHGLGAFLHLSDPDHILQIVFAIGYLNMLVGAYVIFYLARHYQAFVGPSDPAATGSRAE